MSGDGEGLDVTRATAFGRLWPGPRESAAPDSGPGRSLPETVRGIEKDRILRTLSDCQGIQTRAAQALGLTVRQLVYKLKKYGIKLRVPQAD